MRSLSQNFVMTASYARKKKAYGKLTARAVMPLSRVDSDAAFQHFTSVQPDQSGNAWLSSNWSQLVPPVGGVGIAEIAGVALGRDMVREPRAPRGRSRRP